MRVALAILLLNVAALAQRPVPPKPFPMFLSGDECLFCHRGDVGRTWQTNAHTLTMVQKEDAPELVKLIESEPALAKVASEVKYFMIGKSRVRFLKKTGYGHLAILSTQAVVGAPVKDRSHEIVERPLKEWVDLKNPTWDKDKFQDKCTGCHMTAVDSVAKTYAAIGNDCFSCHGAEGFDHAKDSSVIMLSIARLHKGTDSPRAVVAVCAQCHLRGGKSRTTGLPYPYNFVPGEDLFKDYQVDLKKADDPAFSPADRHVYRSVRDVLERGDTSATCIACHQVHPQTTARHWVIPGSEAKKESESPICLDCHSMTGKHTPGYTVHSATCEY